MTNTNCVKRRQKPGTRWFVGWVGWDWTLSPRAGRRKSRQQAHCRDVVAFQHFSLLLISACKWWGCLKDPSPLPAGSSFPINFLLPCAPATSSCPKPHCGEQDCDPRESIPSKDPPGWSFLRGTALAPNAWCPRTKGRNKPHVSPSTCWASQPPVPLIVSAFRFAAQGWSRSLGHLSTPRVNSNFLFS